MDLSLKKNHDEQNEKHHITSIFQPKKTSHFSSKICQSTSNPHSNLYSSNIASNSSAFKTQQIRGVQTTSNTKPPDIVLLPATSSDFTPADYSNVIYSHSNEYSSNSASDFSVFTAQKIRAVETSDIKPPIIVCSSATTSHFTLPHYPNMLYTQSKEYSSNTASDSSAFETQNIRVIKTKNNTIPSGIIYSPVTTSHFTSRIYSRINKTEEVSPLNPPLSSVNTSNFSPMDNKGISPKVIEYVLERQKSAANQSLVDKVDINCTVCSTDEHNPVKHVIIPENDQIPLQLPSMPRIQEIPESTQPNILVKSKRAIRRCIPNVPISKHKPINKKMFQESIQVYNFNKLNKQNKSTKPIEVYPSSCSSIQSSYSVGEKSAFKPYYTQSIKNSTNFEIPGKTELFYLPIYDISMLSPLQATDETDSHSFELQDGLELEPRAYRMCNPSSHNIPLTQFTPIGNSIKPGIPKLSAHEVGDELNICPVILHPSKQLGSQVQMKSDGLIKTIGFAPARSQMTAQAQNRIVTTSMQRSIMESQNVSPLIITPTSHVIHSSNEVVPAKIVPIPSTPAVSHFSVINKTGSYDSIPEYTGIRQSLVPGTPPVYTQSDFARFPPKSYHHKNAVVNPAVIHGPIPGNIDEPCINIPNSQHVFKPIISPRPSILRKRDADGVLRAQKNLIPILTKPDIEECQNTDETSLNRNGYSETGLQLDSLVVPQIPEVRLLPQISALNKQSHIMVEISPRKKPRKQLLPVNQEDSPFKIVGDDMEYVEEKSIKNDKSEDFTDEVFNCNDDLIDGDAEDEAEDDLDDMDVDDDCPADDDYDDDDDDFGNDFGDEFDYVKSDKTFFEENKTPAEVSDESSACVKPKNKRPTLLGSYKNTWRGGNSHHFQRHIDFKVKETKKQLADMQQAKKWTSDSISGWRVRHLLDQFDEMINIEDDIITRMTELMSGIEANVKDLRQRHNLIELVKDNIQRSKVSRAQLDEIRQQLKKIFDYKSLIEDVVDKYCPKDLKKKYAKVFNLSKS